MGWVGCVDLKVSEDSFGDNCFAMSKYSRVNPTVEIKFLEK